jgi:anti-anti-sigma factor
MATYSADAAPSPIEDGKFQLRAQNLGGCVIVRLAGEIDIANAASVQGHLGSLADLGHLVIDLTGLRFMDSTGLSALIVTHKRAKSLGYSIRLVGAQGPVRRVLEITQIDKFIAHYDDVADAVESALAARDEGCTVA